MGLIERKGDWMGIEREGYGGDDKGGGVEGVEV